MPLSLRALARPLLAGFALLVPVAGPAGAQDFSKLKFMTGCWEGTQPDGGVVEENWTTPVDNLMMGVTRYLKKKTADNWEFTIVLKTDSLAAFIAQTKGEVPDTFALKTLVDEVAIFENPAKEFPRRIMYRLTSDGSLIARLEGDPAIGGRDFELRFKRVKCPGR